MHKLLEKALVKKYPKIFKDYGGDITKTCMGWGMSCGNGWFLLIDKLCSKLSDQAVAMQVKEKFGGLRFYLSGTEKDHEVEYEHESKSFKICESCGEPAELNVESGWRRTICDDCDKKRNLASKIREGHYSYCFPDPGKIAVLDHIEEKTIFEGTFSEFMELMSPQLNLLEDPMSTSEKPLWERI